MSEKKLTYEKEYPCDARMITSGLAPALMCEPPGYLNWSALRETADELSALLESARAGEAAALEEVARLRALLPRVRCSHSAQSWHKTADGVMHCDDCGCEIEQQPDGYWYAKEGQR